MYIISKYKIFFFETYKIIRIYVLINVHYVIVSLYNNNISLNKTLNN
jgi:hypothetical protein